MSKTAWLKELTEKDSDCTELKFAFPRKPISEQEPDINVVVAVVVVGGVVVSCLAPKWPKKRPRCSFYGAEGAIKNGITGYFFGAPARRRDQAAWRHPKKVFFNTAFPISCKKYQENTFFLL